MRGTLYLGVECPTLLQVNSDSVHRDEIGEIFKNHLEGFSETSNNQAILNPFYHNKKTNSPKGNDRSPESNVPTSSHFKQASK